MTANAAMEEQPPEVPQSPGRNRHTPALGRGDLGQILIRGAREGEGLAPAGARHFGLCVLDVDATVAELRCRGVQSDVEPWDFGPNMRIAFGKGPDGIRIEPVQTRTPPADPNPEQGVRSGSQ